MCIRDRTIALRVKTKPDGIVLGDQVGRVYWQLVGMRSLHMPSQICHYLICSLHWTPGADTSHGSMGGHHVVLQISVECELQDTNPAICNFTLCKGLWFM